MSKKPRPRYGQYQPKVSLAPLDFEEALKGLLATPPEPKDKKRPAPEKESRPGSSAKDEGDEGR